MSKTLEVKKLKTVKNENEKSNISMIFFNEDNAKEIRSIEMIPFINRELSCNSSMKLTITFFDSSQKIEFEMDSIGYITMIAPLVKGGVQ